MAKKKKPMRIPAEQRQLSYRIGLFSEICLPARTATSDSPPVVLNPLLCSALVFPGGVYASLLTPGNCSNMPPGIEMTSVMRHSL